MSVNRFCQDGLWSQGLQWATGAFGLVPIGLAVFSVPVLAQVVPDNTLGNESSQVTPNVNIRGLPAERIDGGAVRGSALFHSFSEFNVNNGQRVYFSNLAGIADIFSRVTGSNVSNILGTLGVDGGANLFLLNPNGILFGPNAQLDIQGSFLATTGSSFKFSDGSEFSATNPQAAPLLSINVTPGVQWGANQPGATITNRGNLKAGQDLTLAGGNLDVQGQLQAGRDLTLQAQDTLTVRDTVSSPFVATSGRHLTMQGNQSVDIFALNHPQSQLQSGGNFSLISNGNISGDAHLFSGGNLSMLTLSGTPGNFVSLFDPIIRANGDVQFGNYTGVALKVEATGSIQAGNITITGPDNTNTIPVNDPDYATLTGSPSLILRAGLDLISTPNLPQNGGGTSFTAPSLAIPIPLGITVGNINTSVRNGNGGDIILSAAKGDITSNNLDSYSVSGNGGAIALTAGGNITTTNSSLNSSSYGSGDGGVIALMAGNGITTGNLNSFSNSGNGGAIALTAGGNITTTNDSLNSSSNSFINLKDGGAITLTAGNDITTNGRLDSNTYLGDNGGKITLTAGRDITINDLIRSNGGAITLTAGNDITTNSYLSSNSSSLETFYTSSLFGSGDGGKISLTAGRDITTKQFLNSSSFNNGTLAGDGGAISFTAGRDITTEGSLLSYSNSFDSGTPGASSGGAITLTAGGNITTNGSLSSYSTSHSNYSSDSRSGDGGAITLTAGGNITTNGSLSSYSYASSLHSSSRSGDGGAITLTANGNTTVRGDFNSFSYSKSGDSGTGGAISLSARNGSILGESFKTWNGEQKLPVLNSFSVSEKGTAQNGGDVTLEAQNLVSNLDILTLSSYEGAKAGGVRVEGFGNLSLTDANIRTSGQLKLKIQNQEITLDVGKAGQSGDVVVSSLGNLTFNHSRIESDTKGSASAGNVTITSPGLVTFNNSQIINNTNNTGQAGSINVYAPELRLDSSSRLSAKTSSSGRAGDVNLQPYAGGQTLSVFFQDGAEISASSTSSGQGGNILIKGPQLVTLSGNGTLTAETSGSSRAGNVEINTPTLNVNGGAKVSTTTTSTVNTGTGGDITVKANTLNLSGVSSGLFAETEGAAKAGSLTLNPYSGNDLQVNFAEGAKVSASTSGNGRGGDLTVTAPNSVTLSGNGQLAVESTGTGAGGTISINTSELTVQNNAKISASGAGTGQGGNITVQAGTLKLDQGSIVSQTAQSQAGDITLTLNDLLLLRHNSLISTTAGSAQAPGNGGNITISAPFVVAVPYENNDIIANAFSGNGGQINIIDNYRVFGLKPQSRQSFDTLRQNRTSDISASSQFGIQGNINLQSLSVDPSQGLTNLPVDVIDSSRQIVNGCGASTSAAANAQGEFVITGRGGLPPNPDDLQRSGAITPGWVSRDLDNISRSGAPVEPPATPSTPPLVEAQGMFINANGEVVLTAQTSTTIPHQPGFADKFCSPGRR